jgi:hypothetical protein
MSHTLALCPAPLDSLSDRAVTCAATVADAGYVCCADAGRQASSPHHSICIYLYLYIYGWCEACSPHPPTLTIPLRSACVCVGGRGLRGME